MSFAPRGSIVPKASSLSCKSYATGALYKNTKNNEKRPSEISGRRDIVYICKILQVSVFFFQSATAGTMPSSTISSRILQR